MEYWWVNQNQTYQFEVPGGYMWSPKRNRDGAYNQFYENMKDVSPGDVVFSFKDTFIKAVGVAAGHAETAAKPTEFSVVDNPWSQEGWFVPVSFTELETPLRPKDHINRLRPYLPSKYSLLQSNGNGLQAVYLANVPTDMADVQVIGVPDERFVEEVMAWVMLKPGETADEEEIREFCKGKIAHYKIPRYVKMTTEFPMTVTGKVQKFRMREMAIEELGLHKAAGIETA